MYEYLNNHRKHADTISTSIETWTFWWPKQITMKHRNQYFSVLSLSFSSVHILILLKWIMNYACQLLKKRAWQSWILKRSLLGKVNPSGKCFFSLFPVRCRSKHFITVQILFFPLWYLQPSLVNSWQTVYFQWHFEVESSSIHSSKTWNPETYVLKAIYIPYVILK